MWNWNRTILTAAAAGFLIAGCSSGNSGNPYPTGGPIPAGDPTTSPAAAATPAMTQAPTMTGSPSMTASPTTSPAMAGSTAMTVPPDAITKAEGKYDKISFVGPSEPGLIYVYDVTASTLIAKTSLGQEYAGRQLTMLDLKNVTRDLDMNHDYRISFKPDSRMMTPPTTMPAGAR